MKSISTDARQDDLVSFIREAVGQGQLEGQANAAESGSAAQDDGIRGLDDEPDEDDETLIIPTQHPDSEACLWLIKLPKCLLERWSAVDEDGRQLGTLRVWEMKNPENGLPYMTIYAPSEEDPKVMEEFDITVLRDVVKNHHVFADYDGPGVGEAAGAGEEPSGAGAPRAKFRILVGKVTSSVEAAAQPQGHVEMVDDREGVKLMTDNVSKKNVFNTAIEKSRLAKKPGNQDSKDKFTRMPHDELVKLLFVLFEEKPHWGVKELKLRTKQPLAYLQQVLPEVAEKVDKGTDKGKWKLTSGYRDALSTLPEESGGSASQGSISNAVKGIKGYVWE